MESHVCVAGTFDHLHPGHLSLLSHAFTHGLHVLIGLTSDSYVKRYKKGTVRPFAVRRRELMAWLRSKQWVRRATVVAIDDPFEPALSSKDLGAIIVSEETKKRGEELNEKRKKLGLAPLRILAVPMVRDADGTVISSSKLRREIGVTEKLVMPRTLRDELTKPLGKVLTTPALIAESFEKYKKHVVAVVGDCSTQTLLEAGVKPSLAVIDNKVGRHIYRGLAGYKKTSLAHTHRVKSGPGFIAGKAILLIETWAGRPKTHTVIEVSGEEDLLVLPVIESAPIGSVVYYGQPPVAAWACGPAIEGLVEVTITPEVKRHVTELLSRFRDGLDT